MRDIRDAYGRTLPMPAMPFGRLIVVQCGQPAFFRHMDQQHVGRREGWISRMDVSHEAFNDLVLDAFDQLDLINGRLTIPGRWHGPVDVYRNSADPRHVGTDFVPKADSNHSPFAATTYADLPSKFRPQQLHVAKIDTKFRGEHVINSVLGVTNSRTAYADALARLNPKDIVNRWLQFREYEQGALDRAITDIIVGKGQRISRAAIDRYMDANQLRYAQHVKDQFRRLPFTDVSHVFGFPSRLTNGAQPRSTHLKRYDREV